MPGVVAFARKWAVGSDDLWLPALLMLTLHLSLAVVLVVSLAVVPVESSSTLCSFTLECYAIGFIIVLAMCSLVEACIVMVSMRGTVIHDEHRAGIPYLIYIKVGVSVLELFWLVLGIVWLTVNYYACEDLLLLKGILFGAIGCCWLLLLLLLCASWYFANSPSLHVKSQDIKKGSDTNCSSLCPDVNSKQLVREIDPSVASHRLLDFLALASNQHSLMTASRVLSCIVKGNDLLNIDIFAGLLLLRKQQKAHRACVLSQNNSEIYEFLSGVPITPTTRFVSLRMPNVLHNYKKTVHFMSYCLAQCQGRTENRMMTDNGWLHKLTERFSAAACSRNHCPNETKKQCQCWPFDRFSTVGESWLTDCIGCTYCIPKPIFHKEVLTKSKVSFSVSIDHVFKAVVLTISADFYIQDILKGLGADTEVIPVDPPHEDWHAHKDLLQLAVDIRQMIRDELVLTRAFCLEPEKGTSGYSLIVVGHSLGAGVAAILSILLRNHYPNLHCYAYSPPGALLSATCAEETKAFITAVVVGKDIFARLGISQLESLEKDLVNSLKKSTEHKWQIIGSNLWTMCSGSKPDDNALRLATPSSVEIRPRHGHRLDGGHTGGGQFCRNGMSQMLLAMQTAMYPPGRIMHIVRSHPKNQSRWDCRSKPVIYQAVWAENADFDQILVSPTMLSDHCPETVFNAMKKVITRVSPVKPTRAPMKPSQEMLVGSSEVSHFTADDFVEPACQACTSQSLGCPMPDSSTAYDAVDCAAAAAAQLRTGVVRSTAERNSKARSFPPSSLMTHSGYPCVDDWFGLAPLASPETLSESSSLASCGSNNVVYQRVSCAPPPHMVPIIQSPARSANSRDCCLFLEASDVVGELAVLSPSVEFLPLPLVPHPASDSSASSTQLEDQHSRFQVSSSDECASDTVVEDDLPTDLCQTPVSNDVVTNVLLSDGESHDDGRGSISPLPDDEFSSIDASAVDPIFSNDGVAFADNPDNQLMKNYLNSSDAAYKSRPKDGDAGVQKFENQDHNIDSLDNVGKGETDLNAISLIPCFTTGKNEHELANSGMKNCWMELAGSDEDFFETGNRCNVISELKTSVHSTTDGRKSSSVD